MLCAVSGGADSVCLLDLLRREGRGIEVLCAHFNHGLRGAESDRDEAFVRSLCAAWDIPFRAGRGDAAAWAAARRLSVEEAARRLRYAFLERAADESGADRIATAHTASDNAETMLLNLARGTGGRGLGGIPPRRGRVVRPLLGVTRPQVEAYLAARGLPHVEDSTNALDDAARNRVRHAAVPALESVNAAFVPNALRAARLCRADGEYLDALAREAGERLRDGEGLDAAGLLALPEPLAWRVLRDFAGGELSAVHAEAVFSLCRSANPSAAVCLPGLTVRREYGRLLRGEGETPVLPEREVAAGTTLPLPEAGLLLRAEIMPAGAEIQSSFNTFSFSCDKICGKLSVTSRREGDTVVLRGREGTRTLKKLMTDAKLPRRLRGAVPVLRDGAGVLAVYGFGQADRARAAAGETALRVTITETAEE